MSTLVTTNLKHGGSSSDNIVLNSDGTFNVGSAKFETPSGSAPMYQCRAWVNFNGTGTVAIRASGNVSSITDNGVGDYTVNFTTAMPDTNYMGAGSAKINDDAADGNRGTVSAKRVSNAYQTTSNIIVTGFTQNQSTSDALVVNWAVFR